jgi:hypothetical protein
MTEMTTNVLTGCPEEVYEFLHNVIQDAQASGSVVNIITIIPSQTDDGDGGSTKGCKPGSDRCPKT